MSDQISTAHVKQFSSNVTLLCQQEGSILRPFVDEETLIGKAGFFDQIGKSTARTNNTRHGDSPQMNTPHKRRMITGTLEDWGDFIDTFDKVQTLADFTSPYVQSGGYAIGEGIDKKIIAAATGTSRTGEEGEISLVLPTAQKVAKDYVESGAAADSGLTIGKLRKAKLILDQGQVAKRLKRFCVVGAQQIQDLLKTTEITSSDYNIVKALVAGEVDTFLGFKFLQIELLALASSVRTCFCFAEGGIKLAIQKEMTAKIAERTDKCFSWYAYIAAMCGATRMEEAKVVELACKE